MGDMNLTEEQFKALEKHFQNVTNHKKDEEECGQCSDAVKRLWWYGGTYEYPHEQDCLCDSCALAKKENDETMWETYAEMGEAEMKKQREVKDE